MADLHICANLEYRDFACVVARYPNEQETSRDYVGGQSRHTGSRRVAAQQYSSSLDVPFTSYVRNSTLLVGLHSALLSSWIKATTQRVPWGG